MTKCETPPDEIPAKTDDARSIDGPAADLDRGRLAKAAAKGLHRAMEDLTQAPENPTTREKQEQQHGKK